MISRSRALYVTEVEEIDASYLYFLPPPFSYAVSSNPYPRRIFRGQCAPTPKRPRYHESALGQEPEPHAVHSQEMTRDVGLGLQLLS